MDSSGQTDHVSLTQIRGESPRLQSWVDVKNMDYATGKLPNWVSIPTAILSVVLAFILADALQPGVIGRVVIALVLLVVFALSLGRILN